MLRAIHTETAAFREYMQARCQFLQSINIPNSCRDPLAEYSEWLVAQELSATFAPSRVQKDYDLIRPDGRRVQVRYLANPSGRWVNEHQVQFSPEIDDYALVVFETFALLAVVVFPREAIADVCVRLRKRHPNQDCSLQLTRKNLMNIFDDESGFDQFGVHVYRPARL